MRLLNDPATGDVAIYDETVNGDAPLSAPLSNLAALRFHSALDYPTAVKVGSVYVTTGTLSTLGAQSTDTWSNSTINLFAHGQTGTPIVFGKLTISGTDIPLVGSTPLILVDVLGTGGRGAGRWAHLGADTTNVMLRVFSIATTSQALAAMSGITYTIFVTNLRLDGAQPSATDPGIKLRMQPTRFTASEGKFDSNNRYMRTAAAAPQFKMTKGATIQAAAGISGQSVSMRFNVGGWDKGFGQGLSGLTGSATTQDAKFY